MRFLLIPFSVLYGMAIGFRNFLFNTGIRKSTAYKIPIIVVGNLTVGGTGKTPHVEMIIRMLHQQKISCAVLSRGYGRRTKGFLEITTDHSAWDAGDEPRQIKQKFPRVPVIVDGNRRRAIGKIREIHPEVQVIIMDDGFQHRKVKPGLSLLLRDYESLDQRQFLLPAGRLREPLSAAKRADHQIITRTPEFFSPMEKRIIREEVQKFADQDIFFTYMHYGDLHSPADEGKASMFGMEYYAERGYHVMLFAGIAKPVPLEEKLRKLFGDRVHTHFFSDHHDYTASDLEKMLAAYRDIPSEDKILITTEKDAMRLVRPDLSSLWQQLPLFYLSIEARFHHDDQEKFLQMLRDYLRKSFPLEVQRKI